MQSCMNKIIMELTRLGSPTKKLIKHGINAFFVLFALGTLLVVLNRVNFGYNTYMEFIAQSVVKNSFIVLAEFIIGGLVIDYVLKKR